MVWLEAALILVAAKMALQVVPFARLRPFFEKRVRGPELSGEARRRAVSQVRDAIFVAAQALPGQYVCFPRGIAAQAMLRRRGVSTTLYYGAATFPEKGLTGHVWVLDGEEDVIGSAQAPDYHVLARYPSG